MEFKNLAIYLSQLEATASRNKITEILAELFQKASEKEIDKICYLCLGELAPVYADLDFNLAEKLMIRVISKAFGIPEEKIKREYKRLGDLGEVGEKFNPSTKLRVDGERSRTVKVKSSKLKVKNFSIDEVYERLYEIANENGAGSVERKINKMAALLNELDGLSSRYVIRIPLGRLRLGFSELTILDALSWLLTGDKSKRQEIEAAFDVQADIGQIAKIIKSKEIKGLKAVKIQFGVPVMPALCQRLSNAEEIIKKMCRPGDEVAVEPKYDGTRLQIHWSKGATHIFTRNLENVTQMFPDLIQALNKEVKPREVIFDGEAIGFDPKTGKFLPFQETIKRKRKYLIGDTAKEIPLKYFVFDILYQDSRDLISVPFNERRRLLERTVISGSKTILISPQIITESAQELRKFHNEQIKKGLEGIVVKKWEASYDPGRRGYTWVKLKQEKGKKGGGLTDTLDCVVMGYYKGKGKRAKFGIGTFLVGIKQSAHSDKILTISKIGTGLTDEQWRELKVKSEKLKVKDKPKEYLVDKNLFPDVWCFPKILVEIEADNVTKSPIHTAQYALRFPRLVRFRDDKSAEEATTLSEAKKLYQLQG